VPSRLQITSLHETPSLESLRNQLRKSGFPQDIPVVGSHGVQWLTLSDGNYSISAVLSPDIQPLVRSGQLKTISIVELDAYVVLDNTTEAPQARTALIK